MARYAIAALMIVALATGLWWFLASDESTDTTILLADPPSTMAPAPTTITDEQPTTTTTDSHVVETVEEAEAILRGLWFGWFEGIYNQDEDRIREVVATEEQVEVARGQFAVMEFLSRPTSEGISLENTEILRTDAECLALEATVVLSDFRVGESHVLHVVRWIGDRWVLLGLRADREDLWESDCERSLS